MTVRDVPVEGFWPVSVYNSEAVFQKNDANAYVMSSVTARKNVRR